MRTLHVVTQRLFFPSLLIFQADGDCNHKIKRHLAPWKKSYDKPRQRIKKRIHRFADKSTYKQSYGFSSSHVRMWELNHKNWCFRFVVLEKTLEYHLDNKEIKPVHPKGNQPWIFIGSTDVEAKAPILWPPDVKSWLIGKDLDAGKDWEQEKRVTEDEMVWWYHWFNGCEFEWTLGDSEGLGSLACCSLWGCKELDTTERLNNNK